MANTSQALNLEGLHREMHGIAKQIRIMNENNARLIQHLATSNPPYAVTPIQKEGNRSRCSHRSGDHDSQSHHSTSQAHSTRSCHRRSPCLHSRREKSHILSQSQSSTRTPDINGEKTEEDHNAPRCRDKSTTQKIRDLDTRIDAINMGANAIGIIDALIRQVEPPFTEIVMRTRVSSKFKLQTHLEVYEGKTNPMDHLDSYKNLMALQGYSDEVVLEVEDASDKVVVMAMMEGLRLEELVQAKCGRQGRDDRNRKEPDTRRADYRDEAKSRDYGHNTEDYFQLKEQIADLIKREYLRKFIIECPQPDSPERRYGNNRPTMREIQVIHGRFGFGVYSNLSQKRHARNANRQAEEEAYNLSMPAIGTHQPIIFTNDNMRGIHLPHDDVLVISITIANFNVQRILVDNGSSTDILFISTFDKMKIRRDTLHPHTLLVKFGGNAMHPLG
ncbi:hypothetical protein Acr_00g0082700 [Actinidia rufa]|uniref:Reverse transcriptase domain-containing protein n=1 Tax=Actinidia rufa TaxID=165716 RepID=A0A7J0DUM7_9ERIC|nr:hypothetical protein Acr_00g0082700 [Actinidia rufa]